MGNKPYHTIRDGACKVTIWRNEKPEGEDFWYEFVPGRTYTDKRDDTVKTSHSFGADDILIISLLLQEAWTWARGQRAKDRTELENQGSAR